MHKYYCKNCNNIVGKWYDKYEWYNYCNFIESKNNKFIFFLDCEKCEKFVGMFCKNVCINCFGKNEIFGEKNLFNWFLKYKKILNNFKYICEICNEYNIRFQYWFFKELTFYK